MNVDLKKIQIIVSIVSGAISGIYAAAQTAMLIKKAQREKRREAARKEA